MKMSRWQTLAAVLAVPLPALVAISAAHAEEASDHCFSFHKGDVLGTSLDLKVIAPAQADADACFQTVLKEIERLRGILSTYDAQSEISQFQVNNSADMIRVSEDLHAVLLDYQMWRTKSGGAYSANMGELIAFWNAAEKKAVLPSDAELAPLLARVKQNPYTVSMSENEVRRLSTAPLNVDSLGKGYIVQKCAALARGKHPTVTGLMLNIGGDITALGFESAPSVKPPKPWTIAVADPAQPADNAPALTTLHLTNKAVATSGSYQRFFSFGDKKLSHIINPLTGRPSTNDVVSATVIAADNATANALATILCVVPPAEGVRLVERTEGAAALLVMGDGKQMRTRGMAAFEAESGALASAAPDKAIKGSGGGDSGKIDAGKADGGKADGGKPAAVAAVGEAWPKGFSLGIDLTLLPFKNQAPYTAVWIEDANGRCVKVLAAWVGNRKYMNSLSTFSPIASHVPDFARLTKPTRRAGQYGLVWDGTNLDNTPVPPGNYVVSIEAVYEHGQRTTQKLPITCGATRFTDEVPASNNWKKAPVIYGPGLPRGGA